MEIYYLPFCAKTLVSSDSKVKYGVLKHLTVLWLYFLHLISIEYIDEKTYL